MISVENRKFSQSLMYFAPPVKGFLNGIGSKTRMIRYWVDKEIDDIFIHLDTIHECDIRMDTQMDRRHAGNSKDRANA